MKTVFSFILAAIGVVAILVVVSSLVGMGSAASPLVGAGGAIGGTLVALGAFVVLYFLRVSSPEHRAAVSFTRHEVASMEPEDLQTFVCEEIRRRIGIDPDQESKNMVGDLNVPRGALNTVLDDLQIDYNLPISSDDADVACSVKEVAQLVAQRRSLE
jgi:hypothetical protein